MADSTSHIDTIATAQAQKEVTANAALNAQAPAADFGRRDTQSTNLTFGLYGARGWRVDGVHTARGNTTVLATASITGYVEVDRDGVQTFSATKTAGKRQSFEVTSGATAVSGWKDLRPFKPYKWRLAKALPDADYTLTADECICDILEFTGTLTVARNVIVPAVPEVWECYNGTTGGFDIVVKTPSGTGVTIGTGSRVHLYCDGTNVVSSGGGSGGSALPVADTTAIVKGSADNTKQLRFEIDGFTASTTRVVTPQNKDGIMALTEPRRTAIGFAATVSVDMATTDVADIGTLTGNITSFGIANGADGQEVLVRFKQDTTGSRTVTADASIGFNYGLTALTINPTASAVTVCKFVKDAGTGKFELISITYLSALSVAGEISIKGDNAKPFTQQKSTVAVSAPGAGFGLLRWEAGTNAGTLKLVAYSGTSTTGVTIVDNIGSGN